MGFDFPFFRSRVCKKHAWATRSPWTNENLRWIVSRVGVMVMPRALPVGSSFINNQTPSSPSERLIGVLLIRNTICELEYRKIYFDLLSSFDDLSLLHAHEHAWWVCTVKVYYEKCSTLKSCLFVFSFYNSTGWISRRERDKCDTKISIVQWLYWLSRWKRWDIINYIFTRINILQGGVNIVFTTRRQNSYLQTAIVLYSREKQLAMFIFDR
jgi:glycosyltransferase involved in cell wall biosynthesis